jgi:hypothetical protein
MLKERLRKYDRKFYSDFFGPLLREAKENRECDFAASGEALALIIHQLDRGVDEEIKRIFSEHSRDEAEKQIMDIMKAYIYTMSRILNTSVEAVSELVGLEESMHLYSELLKTKRS